MSAFSPTLRALAVPAAGWITFAILHQWQTGWLVIVAAAVLLIAVVESVHHAESVSKAVGEPYGGLVLALAVTSIEVSVIVTMMLKVGKGQAGLARDTVFSAIMIILNGLVGLSVLLGAIRHRQQSFSVQGIRSALIVITAISVFTFILPDFTESIPGPFYNSRQLAFVAIVTLVLYLTFLFVQNVRHRDDFLELNHADEDGHRAPVLSLPVTLIMLVLCLGAVVILAESLAPFLESAVHDVGAPPQMNGVVIAIIILLPEAIATIKAAKANKLQQSLNLSLGSALATSGLTIPVVAIVSIISGMPIALGIDNASIVLFLLSLVTLMQSFSTGRTSVLHGVVLLLIFASYLFIMMVP